MQISTLLAKMFLKIERRWPDFFSPPTDADVDIYACAMTASFNYLHNLIFPRFFEKIHVETENLEKIRELAKDSTIIYITKNIGQLEYNFFNYFFLNELLPLSSFVNELSLWHWLSFRQIRYILVERARHYLEYGPLNNPITSGYLGAVIRSGKTVFLQLRSTQIYNDLYWYSPNEDPLTSLLAANEGSSRPIKLVPLHFIWDKRPEGSRGSIVNLFPWRLKKIALFCRNYKNRAVVKIGAPLNLAEMATSSTTNDLSERARALRGRLLGILQQEKKVITGPAIKPRSFIINTLLEDEDLQKTIYDVANERKHEVEDAQHLARKYANELAADINFHYIETSHRVIKWALKNIYDGIVIDQEGLSRLKKTFAESPVVLVPNHRSHMDYLILSSILYDNNITLPHVAAGINLSFWPMGRIFRKCGAFFMRRTFAGNKLYRAVIKAYIAVLLKEGYCQEFFIEGARSRTGKLLRPKLGLLTMIAEIMKEKGIKNTAFVPVAITYDQVIEEYKTEIAGEVKKAERTRDLIHLKKHFKRKYGKIYVRFGEPIIYSPDNTEVRQLSNAITITINREIIATPVSIAALALLMSPKRGITYDLFQLNIEEIIDYLKWKGARFSFEADERLPSLVYESIHKLISERHIYLHKEFEPTYYEIKEEGRAHLDYYKNNIIHFFVSGSIIAGIMTTLAKQGVVSPSLDQLKEDYLFCKKLFGYEFSFGTRMSAEEHINQVLSYFKEKMFLPVRLEMFKGILTNFFEAYLVAVMTSKNIVREEERDLIKMIIRYGRHLYLLGRITRPEAISSPILQNALRFLADEHYLETTLDQKGRKTYIPGERFHDLEKLKLKLEELC